MAVFEAASVVVSFRPRGLRLRVYSGVVAGKIVYEALEAGGFGVVRGGFFRVSPIYGADGRVASRLDSGCVYSLRVSAWRRAREFVEALEEGLGGLGYIDVVSFSGGVSRLAAPEPLPGVGGDVVTTVVRVLYGPSFYKYHGRLVLYPSPQRLVASLARRLGDATGLDYRVLYREAALRLELVGDSTRRRVVVLGRGKRQPCFEGEAVYLLAAPEPLHGEALALLRLVGVFGAGGSPGIGFGDARVVSVEG